MKRLTMFLVVWLLVVGGLAAQPRDWNGSGSVFFAPGVAVNGDAEGFMHFGASGDYVGDGGLGLTVEIGALGTFSDFGDSAIGVFSPGLMYAFKNDGKVNPYITGGYTLFFRDETGSGMYVGGGANYWVGDRVGLRFEVRDQILLEGQTVNFLEGRIGIVFR